MRTSTTSYYDSSTITHASYNFTTKDLTVHFNHATYVYEDVPLEDFYSFEGAKSQGKALNEFIKPNFKFEKLTNPNTVPGSLLNELPPADYQLDN
jgi:hypothetical protein|tara:strand:- start:26 stop:310 length:285 start_codon:yes stop_codon:yes gene_type:complete